MTLSKTSLIIVALMVTIASSALRGADVEVTKTGDRVVDANALTIKGRYGQPINGQAFQQNALMSFGGYQYVCWYNADRRVCLGRRKLPKGDWEVLQFADYRYANNDAHNTISLGICPADGTVHLSFDHHNHPLKYRVSSKGAATQPDQVAWTPALFGPIRNQLRKGHPIRRMTYPRFIVTPDNKLQFFYRGGTARVIHTYDPKTGAWSGPRGIVADNGYTNYHLRYGKDGRLQLLWHWRGTGQLCYLYTFDQGRSWKNNSGKTVLAANENKSVNTSDIQNVSVIKTKHASHILLGGQYMDSKSRPHEICWHVPSDTQPRKIKANWDVWRTDQSRYHHYWRDMTGRWHANILPTPAGNRAKIFLDADDNAYAIYMLNKTDQWGEMGMYFTHGELVIATASAESKWTDWQVIHREPGPFLAEPHFDDDRWKSDGVLSVYVQDTAEQARQPTPLRILDFKIDRK